MKQLKRVATFLAIALLCMFAGGVGAAIAVTQVPAVRDAIKGQQGTPGPVGPVGPPGPVGPQGAGLGEISGMYVVGRGCRTPTVPMGEVVTGVTYVPGVPSAFDNTMLVQPSINTDTLELCEVP